MYSFVKGLLQAGILVYTFTGFHGNNDPAKTNCFTHYLNYPSIPQKSIIGLC